MLWGDGKHTHIRIASRVRATAPGVKKEESHGELWIKDQKNVYQIILPSIYLQIDGLIITATSTKAGSRLE